MKSILYNTSGEKSGEVELPKIFNSKIREDIAQKYFEVNKEFNPYSPRSHAGLRQSASGTISHKRHDWKGHYGRGISRVPRKTMWRRGAHFFWIAANIPGAGGGRRAHPPLGIRKDRKINKKEAMFAINSGFSAMTNPDFIKKRYKSLKIGDGFPKIIESLPEKARDLNRVLNKIFGEAFYLTYKKKAVRAGKGKLRGRKYKSNAGVLIVTSSKEDGKLKGVDIKTVKEISISDLYPLGRLAVFTKQAIEELEGKKE